MTMPVLVVLEHEPSGVRHASLALLAPGARLARTLGGDAAAVVTGSLDADPALLAAPVNIVYAADSGDVRLLSHAIDTVAAAAYAAAATVILISETTYGRELAGGVAAKLEAGILTGAHAVTVEEARIVATAAKSGGTIVTRCAAIDGPVVVLIRPNALREEEPPRTPRMDKLAVTTRPREVTIVEQSRTPDGGVALEEADVVVSGGRGLGGPEPFTGMLAELASVVNGAVGASRAVVDAGWAPHAQQVGQTGKTVRPRLYFAVAISGAIQHRVGMQTAGTIVAINKDANIPLAEYADLFVVGDAFALVPELTRQLRRQKGLL